MTTGRINQVHASPPGCSTLTTLTRSQVSHKPCGASPETHFKYPQRDAMRSTAQHQDLHIDPGAQDAQIFKRCHGKPFEIRVLHASHAQLCNPHSHSHSVSSPLKLPLRTLAAVQPQTCRTFRGGHVPGYSTTEDTCHACRQMPGHN